MAIVKITPIKKSSLKLTDTIFNSLEYTTNELKTENKTLVSSFACSTNISTAIKEFGIINDLSIRQREDSVIARHIMQSFSPDDDLTPDRAHKIGIEFCERIFKGEYQYVISTHTDKSHLHNHIVFNTTNIKTHKKYRSTKLTYKHLQKISDDLCAEYNLYIIPKKMSKEKGKTHKEWQEDRKGKSYKTILRKDIDDAINKSNTYEEFIKEMIEKGYEIKDYNSKGEYLKYIAFKNENIGMQKFFRGRDTLLGEKYTRENIQLRIQTKEIKNNIEIQKQYRKIININTNIKAQSITNYRKFSNKFNVKIISETKSFMNEKGIKDIKDFRNYINTLQNKISQIQNELLNSQRQFNNINQIINAYESYQESREIYKEYISISDNEKKKIFFIKHKEEIKKFKQSKEILTQNYPNKIIPKLENIEQEKIKIQKEIEDKIYKLNQKELELKNAKTVYKNYDILLNSNLKQEIKSRINSKKNKNL